MMRELLGPLSLAAALALGGSALAQTAGGDATPATPPATDGTASGDTAQAPVIDSPPAAELPMGETEQPQAPQAYVKDTVEDWRVVCVKLEGDRESCNMQQLLRDQNDNPVSQVSIAPLPPAAAPRAAAVEIATPLETLLSEDLLVKVDDGAAKRYRFSFCTPAACVARFAMSADDVAAFKRGAKASVTIVPLVAPDQKATVTMSLKGFTAAYDLVTETLAK